MADKQGGSALRRCDPHALWWLVGAELVRLRKRAGLSMSKVAEYSGITKSKISHMEAGRYVQQPEDIQAFARACEASEDEGNRIIELASQAEQRTWWGPWESVIPEWLRVFLGLEAFADKLFTYEPLVFPALLQTRAYAEALTQASGIVRPDHVERIIELRQARTQRISRDPALHIHAVVENSVLQRRVGSREVMKDQFRHLLEVSQQPNVTVQVVVPQDGPHKAVPSGRFVLLEFTKASPVAYAELFDDAKYVSDSGRIATYELAARGVSEVARPPEQLSDIIETELREL